jgi:hypothetical protein
MTSPFDCRQPVRAVIWFGVGAALAIMAAAATRLPPEAMIRVGASNPLYPRAVAELGPLPDHDPMGHDGQAYYFIARDPWGRHDTPQIIAAIDGNGPRYRYQRILFPALAGGFGRFSAHTTVWMMILLLVVGMGLASAGIADLASHTQAGLGLVLLALANTGAIVSVMIVTADALAMGLAIIGLALLLRRRRAWALGAFVLAALTKETHLLVPWSMAAWRWTQGERREAWLLAMVPTVPVLAWAAWLAQTMPPGETPGEILGWPLAGIVAAVPYWMQETQRIEWVLLCATAIGLVGAMAAMWRSTGMIRWLVLPWVLLACLSGLRVWGKPNNAARALAMLWPGAVLQLATTRRNDEERQARSPVLEP